MRSFRRRRVFLVESWGTRIPPADGMIGLLGETDGLLKHRRLADGGVTRIPRFLTGLSSAGGYTGLGSLFSGVTGWLSHE